MTHRPRFASWPALAIAAFALNCASADLLPDRKSDGGGYIGADGASSWQNDGIWPAPPASPDDRDGDGFTKADGDCNDNDRNVNPGAIEVDGIYCKLDADCPSQNCVQGLCRCQSDLDCSSRKACSSSGDCAGGEQCQKGECRGAWLCLSPVPGSGVSGEKLCRDNVDNNCDGRIDEPAESCDELNQLQQLAAHDYAKAIELCPTRISCGGGNICPAGLACVDNSCSRVISAQLEGSPAARAIASRLANGGPIQPLKTGSFVVLSTGKAVYDPAQACPQPGSEFNQEGMDPDPASTDKLIYDLSQLKLEIVVPTNARSFSFDFQFFSAEYPEYVGSVFNDTFWVELRSLKHNGNVAFDSKHTPIRINNTFFSICDPHAGAPQTSVSCTQPASVLRGTGFADDCSDPNGGFYPPGDQGTGGQQSNGGSTGWLTTTVPVTPGETITLTFSIFDKGDPILDSTVVIDNFRFGLQAAAQPMTDLK
jgi:hypothetical protein